MAQSPKRKREEQGSGEGSERFLRALAAEEEQEESVRQAEEITEIYRQHSRKGLEA